jgi:hypothetical protein
MAPTQAHRVTISHRDFLVVQAVALEDDVAVFVVPPELAAHGRLAVVLMIVKQAALGALIRGGFGARHG